MSRATGRALYVAVLLVMTATTGCRSYQARPLDMAGYQQEWAEREATDASVAAFAEELTARERWDLEPFAPEDGLTLGEAEAVALLLNPRLRTLRLRAEVPLAGANEAGLWEDPELSFDVMRVLASVQEPWILGTGLGITLPLSGRLAVEQDLAWAEYDAAWREAALAEWELLAELEAAWLQWSATAREVELLRAYVEELGPLEQTTEQLVEAGEASATETRVLQMERARRRVTLDHLQTQAEQQRSRLLAMLGLAPDAQVQLEPAVDAVAPELEPEAWGDAIQAHPALQLARAEYETAEQRLHREIRRQYPDLTIGPRGQRETGQSRIGLGGVVPIPLWNRNQQAIAEAEAAREAARAEAEDVLQRVSHRVDRQRRRWEAARRRRQALQAEVAPLVDEQMQQMQQLIELGELDVLLLQDTLARSLETKQAILKARLEEASAAATVRAMVEPRWAVEPADDAMDAMKERE